MKTFYFKFNSMKPYIPLLPLFFNFRVQNPQFILKSPHGQICLYSLLVVPTFSLAPKVVHEAKGYGGKKISLK